MKVLFNIDTNSLVEYFLPTRTHQMEDIVYGQMFRKLLMLDQLEGVTSTTSHQLLTSHTSYNYLLVGPKRCGKSSILFEYAFQCAEKEQNVLFISKHRLEKLPHFVNDRQQPACGGLQICEHLLLKRVSIYY